MADKTLWGSESHREMKGDEGRWREHCGPCPAGFQISLSVKTFNHWNPCWSNTFILYSSLNVKPKYLNRPLVAGFRIGHNPCLLHVSKQNIWQINFIWINNISVILVSSGTFGINWLFDGRLHSTITTVQTQDGCTSIGDILASNLHIGGSRDTSSIFVFSH